MVAATVFARPSAAMDLVREGKPAAAIVIPAQPLPVESYAAEELQYHVESGTGARLTIASEGTTIPSGARVYLGNRKAAEAVGLHRRVPASSRRPWTPGRRSGDGQAGST